MPRARKGSRKTRSAVKVALVREYETGYRRKPESRREVKAAEAAAVRLLSTEA